MFKTCYCPTWEQSIIFLIVENNADCIVCGFLWFLK